jgi:hypothetical protein
MRFYGLTDEHILKMPANRFWFLYNTALRIEAQEDLRLLNIAVKTGGMELDADGIKSLVNDLSEGVGKVIEFDRSIEELARPDPDFKEKLRKLATMAG